MVNSLQIATAAIDARAAQLTWIGAPTNATTPQAEWFYRDYVNASLYVFVKPDGTIEPVHFLIGDIRIHYKQVGGGFGYPTNDESTTPDSVGRYNFFSHGPAIYWTPSTGAHAIYGDILLKWKSLGYERSALGYPTTDETSYGTRGGRFNDFQFGSINWSPATGAHVHIGALPTTLSAGQNFTFPSGTPVGGWTNVEVHSDGSVRFRGDFHDSGFAPMEFSVVDVVKDADNVAYSLRYSGGLGGTISGGPRDNHWDLTTQNSQVRDNWRSLVATFLVAGHADTNLDFGETLSSALKVLGAVETVISLI